MSPSPSEPPGERPTGDDPLPADDPWSEPGSPTAQTPTEDSLTEEVLALLDQQNTARRSAWSSLLLLGASLLVFAGTGLLDFDAKTLTLLVVILLIHEGGHYLGMRLFGYRDVRMFFVPFLGAAVSGKQTNVAGWKQVIVILLGPLPGMLLGTIVGAINFMVWRRPEVQNASAMFIALNAFNLLPFLPLDGGRLLHLIIFSRQPHLEALFRAGAGLLLAVGGFGTGTWILGGLGVLMLMGTPTLFQLSKIARDLRPRLAPTIASLGNSIRIPREAAVTIIDVARKWFPRMSTPKNLVPIVNGIWDRVLERPPAALASFFFLGIYATSILATPFVLAFLYFWPLSRVAIYEEQDGSELRRHEVYQVARLRQVDELDDQDLFHGRHTRYRFASRVLDRTGRWEHGLRDGTWTFYDSNGEEIAELEYDQGQVSVGLDELNALPDSAREAIVQSMMHNEAATPEGPATFDSRDLLEAIPHRR